MSIRILKVLSKKPTTNLQQWIVKGKSKAFSEVLTYYMLWKRIPRILDAVIYNNLNIKLFMHVFYS